MPHAPVPLSPSRVQESGWWDGLLREERGWFPSNYVKTLEPSELEALSESDGPQSDAALADDSVVDMAQALAGQSDSESEWMGAAVDPRAVVEQPVRTNAGGTGVQSDFWVPQVTGDGQVRAHSVRRSPPAHAYDIRCST